MGFLLNDVAWTWRSRLQCTLPPGEGVFLLLLLWPLCLVPFGVAAPGVAMPGCRPALCAQSSSHSFLRACLVSHFCSAPPPGL